MTPEDVVGFVESYIEERRGLWRRPLVGFADAKDRLFKEYSRMHGFKTPTELVDGAKSVIMIFIPFKEHIVHSNASLSLTPSREWALAYIEANKLLEGLCRELVHGLSEEGYRSLYIPPTGDFDRDTFASSWSHKHAGYIAGLGTFGMHHQLITKQGCCGRLGSVVTQASFKPTPRSDEEFCLHKRGYNCLMCLSKCPVGALTYSGLDKRRCYEQCLKGAEKHRDLGLAEVCGKCSCGTPCSLQVPKPF